MTSLDTIEIEEPMDAVPAPLLNRVDRAAVFLMLLNDEEAAGLLSRLGPDQLEQIGAAMCRLGDIEQAEMAEALDDFVGESAREILAQQDRGAQVRGLLERSIGPTKAESMMMRIDPDPGPRSIEMARWLAPALLLKLVEDEHPQVIAALLLMLDPEPAAEVLSALPNYIQPIVVERVARIGPVSQQAVDMIDKLLSQRIGASFGANALALGGAREAANLINLAAGDLRGTVLPAIAQRDGPLAERIEEELFTFEMLFELEAQAMERLLRDVDSEALVDALKGLKDAERAPFFKAMSSRAADGIRDEIEMRGRLSRGEVDAAKRKIVEVARSLAEQGEIVMGGDDGEFV
ncbi:MAG: FliG C-terminal domain-containing protein [Erythrobacter sp.]